MDRSLGTQAAHERPPVLSHVRRLLLGLALAGAGIALGAVSAQAAVRIDTVTTPVPADLGLSAAQAPLHVRAQTSPAVAQPTAVLAAQEPRLQVAQVTAPVATVAEPVASQVGAAVQQVAPPLLGQVSEAAIPALKVAQPITSKVTAPVLDLAQPITSKVTTPLLHLTPMKVRQGSQFGASVVLAGQPRGPSVHDPRAQKSAAPRAVVATQGAYELGTSMRSSAGPVSNRLDAQRDPARAQPSQPVKPVQPATPVPPSPLPSTSTSAGDRSHQSVGVQASPMGSVYLAGDLRRSSLLAALRLWADSPGSRPD